jgi:hypothetical protein
MGYTKIKKTALNVGFRPGRRKKKFKKKGFYAFPIKNGWDPVFSDNWSGPNGPLLLEC